MLSATVLVILWVAYIYYKIHIKNHIKTMKKENRISYESVKSTGKVSAVIFSICVLVLVGRIDNIYQDVFLSCFELFLGILWCLKVLETRYCIVKEEGLEIHNLKVSAIDFQDIKSFAFFDHDVINNKKVKEFVVFTEEKMIPILGDPINEKCMYEYLISHGIEYINSEGRLKAEICNIAKNEKHIQQLRNEKYKIVCNLTYILPIFLILMTITVSAYGLGKYSPI